MDKFIQRWKRGFWLLLIISLSQLCAGLPWFLVQWIIPDSVVPEGSAAYWTVTIATWACFPVVFYLTARALGLELEEWRKEDSPENSKA